jgi:magnesium chelatase family protein
LRPVEVRQFCALEETGKFLMQTALNQIQLSARAYLRVLKLARTIADLARNETIQPADRAEAWQHHPRH